MTSEVEEREDAGAGEAGTSFVWRDAGRTVLFGEDGIARAPELLAEHGFGEFELLTTERALHSEEATALAEAAAGVLPVRSATRGCWSGGSSE